MRIVEGSQENAVNKLYQSASNQSLSTDHVRTKLYSIIFGIFDPVVENRSAREWSGVRLGSILVGSCGGSRPCMSLRLTLIESQVL